MCAERAGVRGKGDMGDDGQWISGLPHYGAPTYRPKKHSTANLVKLVQDVLLLKGAYHLWKSGMSPAEIVEVAKRQAHVPLNKQLELQREAKIVRSGGKAGPILRAMFPEFVCQSCGAEFPNGAKFCGMCGQKR